MRVARFLAGSALVAAAVGFFLTQPAALPAGFDTGDAGNPVAGAVVFAAAGCAACHVGPGASVTDQPVLTGGKAFASDFGTFHAPNISPDPVAGIGAWSLKQFARAVTLGVSPEGQHYYPAFPYAAYQHMTARDVADLFAHIQTLPASATPSLPHDIGFPFNVRRGLGLWKLAFADAAYMIPDADDPVLDRGRYLAEGLAHCGECHTARNALGGLDRTRWMAGGPNPSGKGTIPNITPAALEWSEAELIEYLTSGFTPEYDNAGGQMADVVANLAKLPEADRAAIAAYVMALPAIP